MCLSLLKGMMNTTLGRALFDCDKKKVRLQQRNAIAEYPCFVSVVSCILLHLCTKEDQSIEG